MADRTKYIALGVRNGVTSLDDIRDTYNSYAEGGYLDWINKVRKWRPGISEDIDAEEPKRYNKFGEGGPSKNEYVPSTLAGWVTQLFTGDNTKAAYADIGSSAVNIGADAIPVVGNVAGTIISVGDTLYDAGKLTAGPSWENVTDLGSSLLGIIPGAGSVKDVKNISKASRQAYRNVKTTRSVRAVKKTVTRKTNPKSNARVNVLRPDMKVERSYPL